MRLWVYLSLLTNFLILLIFAAYGTYSSQQYSRQHLLELKAETHDISHILANAASHLIQQGGITRLQHLLPQVQLSAIEQLYITDIDGHILAQLNNSGMPALNSPLTLTPTQRFEHNHYVHLTPVLIEEQITGWVMLRTDIARVSQQKSSMWQETLLAGLLCSLALSLMLIMRLRKDSQALEQATDYARNLVQTPDTPLKINSSIYEFNQLQSALNQAALLLKSQFRQLRALDDKQKKTNELLQDTINDLAAKQFALDQHAIVSISDLSGRIIYVNERFCQISQYTQQELLGQKHSRLKSNLQSTAFYQKLWQTITRGDVWRGEFANRCKDGGLYWVAATIVPMNDVGGNPTQFICISTDITFQKRTRQQLGMNQKFLQQMIEKYRSAEQELAQAQQRELDIGSQIQRTLLLGELPTHLNHIALAAHTEASRGVDGDFYQYFQISRHSLDLTLGDVMGKGVPAALIGAAVKQQLNQVIAQLLAQKKKIYPEVIIETLHQQMTPKLIQLETFVTLCYLRIDLQQQMLTVVDAGHPPILQLNRQGVQRLSGRNLPIGVMEHENYQQIHYPFQPQDIIMLYSDGITEARNPDQQEFGIDRLCQLLQRLWPHHLPLSTLLQCIRYQVSQFEQTTAPSDDRSCLLLQIEPPAHCYPLKIEWRLETLQPFRQQLTDNLRQQTQLDETEQQELVLAVFEACSNIIRHNSPLLEHSTIDGHMTLDGDQVSIHLYYLGQPFEQLKTTPDFSGSHDGGFGLYIIEHYTDQVKYQCLHGYINHIQLIKTPSRYAGSHAPAWEPEMS